MIKSDRDQASVKTYFIHLIAKFLRSCGRSDLVGENEIHAFLNEIHPAVKIYSICGLSSTGLAVARFARIQLNHPQFGSVWAI